MAPGMSMCSWGPLSRGNGPRGDAAELGVTLPVMRSRTLRGREKSTPADVHGLRPGHEVVARFRAGLAKIEPATPGSRGRARTQGRLQTRQLKFERAFCRPCWRRGRDALEGSRLRRALEMPYARPRETCSSLRSASSGYRHSASSGYRHSTSSGYRRTRARLDDGSSLRAPPLNAPAHHRRRTGPLASSQRAAARRWEGQPEARWSR